MPIAIEGIGGGGSPVPPPTDTFQNSQLLSGGQVVWVEDYTFLVSAAHYVINGIEYDSPETTIVLDAAHATLDRIDVIAVDDQGAVINLTGTAATQPSEPDIDPGTQLKLSIVLVTANTTEPPAVTSVLLYADNAGGPTEWNWTASGASINVNSSNNPHAGTKTIEGTNVVAGVYAQGAIPSGLLQPNLFNYLVMYIRSKANWTNNRGLQVSLRSSGVLVGNSVAIRNSGTFGFDSTNTTDYQVVAIPTVLFGLASGMTINQVRIADFGGSIGFYIDDITFQGNVVQVAVPPPPVISAVGAPAVIIPPVNSEWTSFNLGSSTRRLDETGSIIINSPNNGSANNLRGILRALPTPPYEVVVGIIPAVHFQQFSGAGVCFRESATGKLAYVRVLSTGATGLIAGIQQWTDQASGSAGDYISPIVCAWLPWTMLFVKLADDGVNRITSWGPDGSNFIQQHSVARLNFLTLGADQVFVCSEPFSNPAGVTLKSYRRVA